MKPLQNHALTFVISLCVLGFSLNSVINLSLVSIDSGLSALWVFIAIVLTIFGLFISPVLVVMSLGGLIKECMNPQRKSKQKNDF